MNIENIADLRVLIQTARTGSLTAAATALRITPAAASATLKRLETQLRVRLFIRSTRAMRLTADGKTLLGYATRAFDVLAEGEAQITDCRSSASGTVRVTAPSELTRSTLLPLFNEFLKTHPELRLALQIGDRPVDVMKDDVDLAIRYGAPVDSHFVARELAVVRPFVSASPDYLARHAAPKSPRDLLEHNCLVFNRGGRPHDTWRFVQDKQWTEVDVSGDRIVDDASLAYVWALAGFGIILKPPIGQQQDFSSGALVRLLSDWDTEPYPLHALIPSGRFVPKRVRLLVEFLMEKFDQLVPKSECL